MSPPKALFLIGSPRAASNSAALAGALEERLQARGWAVETKAILPALRSEEAMQTLLTAAREADLWVFSSPLYADGVPSVVLECFERLAATRQDEGSRRRQRMAVLVNCGFPESSQNAVALEIYQAFAKDVGLEWAGGLAMGMGELLGQRPLTVGGGKLRPVLSALDLAADALSQTRAIPEDAVRLMARPLIPKWLYRLGGTWGFRREARKNQLTRRELLARPYSSA